VHLAAGAAIREATAMDHQNSTSSIQKSNDAEVLVELK
jgi:hypothetical protein